MRCGCTTPMPRSGPTARWAGQSTGSPPRCTSTTSAARLTTCPTWDGATTTLTRPPATRPASGARTPRTT
ncbi:hypothetical protein G6F45_013863 [Rhizopus arrhizus]|nr:hypothetical protein G6F40_016290 [Rhizopus arrhizus]KAG1606982.1 hypothetical protein G6F45_013863 [Rhizopus arrhizus]